MKFKRKARNGIEKYFNTGASLYQCFNFEIEKPNTFTINTIVRFYISYRELQHANTR